jgi:large repetitive protein
VVLGQVVATGASSYGLGTTTGAGQFSFEGSAAGGALKSNGVSVSVQLVNGQYVGMAGATEVFRLSINPSTGAYTFALKAPLDHADGQNANDLINLKFAINVADADGDKGQGIITVGVIDDAPVAVADTLTVGAANGSVGTGNVQLNDTIGLDGQGKLIQVSVNGVTKNFATDSQTDSAGKFVTIAGSLGNLKIYENGTYSYIKTAANQANGVEQISYVVKDFDGDTASAKLMITVQGVDLLPQAVNDANDLNDGAMSGTGNVLDNDYQGDGPAKVTMISFGNQSVAVPTSGNVTINGAYGVLTINANGTYSYTRTSPQSEGEDVFGYKIADADGDVAQANLTIKLDEVPLINPIVPQPNVVDETNPNDNTIGGQFSGVAVQTWSLGAKDGSPMFGSDVALKSNGVSVSVQLINGQYVGMAGTTEVFRVSLNPSTGAYTFALKAPLDHPDSTKENDAINLSFKVTGADNDGDKVDAEFKIQVLDDAPVAVEDGQFTLANPSATVTGNVLSNDIAGYDGKIVVTQVEDFLGRPHQVPATGNLVLQSPYGVLTISSNGAYSYVHNYSGNSNGAFDGFIYTIKDADGDTSQAALSFTFQDKQPVAVDDANTLNDGAMSGTGNLLGNDIAGDGVSRVSQVLFGNQSVTVPTVGSITINGAYGVLTVSANGAYSYARTSPQSAGQDIFEYRIVDQDGDEGRANLTINLDGLPLINLIQPNVVDETNSSDNLIGGQFSGVGVQYFSLGSKTGAADFSSDVTLRSSGVPVEVKLVNGQYVGMAGNTEVFRVILTPSGYYQFDLKAPLDHPNTSNPNDAINLTFKVTASDGDGDKVDATFNIQVLDDAPVAAPDVNVFSGGSTAGNVINGLNGGGAVAADSFGFDNGKLTKVAFGGTEKNFVTDGQTDLGGKFVVIAGQYGVLKLYENGNYTYNYTSFGTHTDVFNYTIVDNDGDKANTTLTLTGAAAEPIVTSVSIPDASVKEDHGVALPIKASYAGGDGDEVMTVRISGVPSGWAVDTGHIEAHKWVNLGGGVYEVTLPAGVKTFDGILGFAPPANSDTDLNGLTATVKVYDPDTAITHTTNDTGNIVVDAVVDFPGLTAPDFIQQYWATANWHANDGAGYAPVPLNISAFVNDVDGSENVRFITVDLTGKFPNTYYPNGPYYDSLASMGVTLNKGYQTSPGVWKIDVNDLSGGDVNLILPKDKNFEDLHNQFFNGQGHQVNIVVSALIEERNLSGNETDYSDNQITVTKNITLNFVITPLVLDLNHNGVDLLNQENGVMFDMNNDGVLDKTSWVASTDALLAIDLNGDGVINNQSELFGDSAEHANGFANLASYDTNGDGKIDSNDAVYDNLLVWQDLNADGISQANELSKLVDHNIASIGVVGTVDGTQTGDSIITHTGEFTYNDGSKGQVVDVGFNVQDGVTGHIGTTMTGSDMADVLYGTSRNDTISGGAGNDILMGGKGHDLLTGGAGADTFVLNKVGEGVDTIADYKAADGDKLDISDLLSQSAYHAGDNLTSFLRIDAATGDVHFDATGKGAFDNHNVVARLDGISSIDVISVILDDDNNQVDINKL